MTVTATMQDATLSRSPRDTSNFLVSLRGALTSARATLESWLRVAETRRHLARLDERMLRDVGFDPQLARREAAKPFWQPYTLVPHTER